jgi:hypothetical protein
MCPLVLVPPCCWWLQDGGLLLRPIVLVAVRGLVLAALMPLLLVPLLPLRLELLFFLTWKREDDPGPGPTGSPLPLRPTTPLRARATATVRQVVAYQDQGAVAGDCRLGLDLGLAGHKLQLAGH